MSEDTIFSNPEEVVEDKEVTVAPTETENPFADQLKMITAEDGRQKYADVNSALQSIPHAQVLINDLKAKVATQEEALAKAQGVEAVLEQLQATPTSQSEVSKPAESGLGVDSVNELIQAQLAQRENQATKQSNLNKINSELVDKFGGDVKVAAKAFSDKAQELGSSVEYLQDIASSNPAMVLALFSSKEASAQATPISQTINTTGLPQSNPEFKPVMIGASTDEVVGQAKLAGIFDI